MPKTIASLALVLLCLVLFALDGNSQCYPQVSPGGLFVSNGGLDSVTPAQFEPQPFVLCHNARLYYYGNNPDTVYLENSALLTVGSSFNLVVYMKAGSSLIIDTTQAGLKHFKEIYYDPGLVGFSDTAGIVVQNGLSACPGLVYDYSSFPGSNWPCLGNAPTSIDASSSEATFEVLNFPGENMLSIRKKGLNSTASQLCIYSLEGKKLGEWEMKGNEIQISMAGFPGGLLLLSMESGAQICNRKILNY